MRIYKRTQELLHLASQSYSHLQQRLQANRELVLTYTFNAVALLVIAVCLLFLVKARTTTFWLGYQISQYEREKKELMEQNAGLAAEIARRTSREELLRRNQELDLQLLPPEQWQSNEQK